MDAKKYCILTLVTFCFIVLLPEIGLSTPIISSATGVLKNGQIISIEGVAFGSGGPQLVVFDDFERGTGDGDKATLTATVGSWDGTGTYVPTYSTISRSGNYSAELSVLVGGWYYHRQFFVDFTPSTEYFLSYAVQVPSKTFFPQKHASAPVGAFPDESVWKFAWIRDYANDSDASPDDDDKCLPTHVWQAHLDTAGNDLGFSKLTIYDDVNTDQWWQWGAWNRMAFWGRADTTNPATAAGEEWAQGIGVSQYQTSNNTNALFAGGTAPYQFTRLHINGWMRTTPSTKPVKLVYDDIYFAVGDNAAARVELGNSAIYSACTKLSIATPVSWSDKSIKATVREGGLLSGEEVYLFVIDSNNIPSVGYGPFRMDYFIRNPPVLKKK